MPVPTAQTADAVYLPSRAVLDRYGRKHMNWLWRRLEGDPKFPRPIQIGGRNYWRLDDLKAYEARAAGAGADAA